MAKKKYIFENPVGSLLGDEEIEAIKKVLTANTSLTRGKEVDLFEKKFSKFIGSKFSIAVSSCGAALELSSKILELKENDEVICQANLFWPTYNHLIKKNVNIKIADINPRTLNIDVNSLKKIISKKTKAVYIMHHGGNPCDLFNINKLKKKFKFKLVEDCAHACGSIYKNKKIGSDSDIACFSFSTLKNITTLGEGGMIVTNSKKYNEYARLLRTNFPIGKRVQKKILKLGKYNRPTKLDYSFSGDAWNTKYWKEISEIGSTFRMSSPQAAVGVVQLKKINHFNLKRLKISNLFQQTISKCELLDNLYIEKNSKSSCHLFCFFIKQNKYGNNQDFIKILDEKFKIKIVNRFFPMNLSSIMRTKQTSSNLAPINLKVWFNELISLPIYPQMRKIEINYIRNSIVKTHDIIRYGKS